MTEEEIEYLKYKLGIRTMFLDKFILALLFAAIAFYANHRLAQYEHLLNSELEQLKSDYGFQRTLDQREVEAHERAWRAVSDFKSYIDTCTFSPMNADEVTQKALNLANTLTLDRLYLTPRTTDAVNSFFDHDVIHLMERWGGKTGHDSLKAADWDWFTGRVNEVRTVIASEIQAKRQARISKASIPRSAS